MSAIDEPRGSDPLGPGPVIDLRGIERVFPGDPPVYALRKVDLTIGAGEYVAIVGPSGSGKSTLLNVLGLLDRPTGGQYLLDGRDVAGLSDRERAWLRAERLGFVFQSFHLLAARSALENVMFGGMYQGLTKRERRRRSVEALERVGMLHRASFRPDHLSGGERQRVAVARALAVQPSIMLADEPTGNLDSENTAAILELLDGLVVEGLTLCLITHEHDVAARAHRQVRIVDGILSEVVRA